jgi:Flp pilus assembly protein TadD
MAKKAGIKTENQTTAGPASPWYLRDWFLGLMLVLGIFLTYHSIRTAGFVWDDDDHITANPTVIGPQGLKEIWTTGAGDIDPLTRSTFWLEYKFFGLSPYPYHLINLLVQGACAILLWLILRRLRIPGAWLAAAIWTLHPLQVESIAWISEMKNTESGLFFLLAIWFYISDLEKTDDSPRPYALTLVFALLAMVAKASAVVLPFSLCICAWWLQKRWNWRNVIKMIPVIAMSAGASVMAIWASAKRQEIHQSVVNPLPDRIIGAGYALWFYLGKFVWPHPLMSLHPGWKFDAGAWYMYLPLLSIVAALALLWPGRREWTRPWFFALAWFVTAPLPALGLVDKYTYRYSGGYSLVYEHFQYLAAMSLAAVAAAAIMWAAERLPPGRVVRALPGATVLIVLALLSADRVPVFQSNETLWADAAAGNPECWSCHYNLGVEYALKGSTGAAIEQFQRSVDLNPDFDRSQNNLGSALLKAGREKEAVVHFEKAIAINDRIPEAHYNLGAILLRSGDADRAIEQMRETLALNPNLMEAHIYLAAALDQKGESADALAEYRAAVHLDPKDALAQHDLGLALAKKGQGDEAIEHLRKAVELDPGYGQAHSDLGVALAQRHEFEDAAAQFREALRVNPDDIHVRQMLGMVQAAEGQSAGRRTTVR